MARQARGEVIDASQVQVLHCVQRCVRRAFLCGADPYSGRSYEHRREWIRERLELLASVFGIDCLTYTVMSNHLHLVLRSRPDVVATWSDDEVARRWLRLFPRRRDEQGEPLAPTESELAWIVRDPDVLAERRRRLSDVSWWMRCTAEVIARRANQEDGIPGRFWQGRFSAQLLLDEGSLLACAAYVDLNPVRAAVAPTPETSEFTGAKDRIDDLQKRGSRSRASTRDWECSRRRQRSGWLAPIEINERLDPVGPDPSGGGRRASDKGFLPSVSLSRYLELLDWTGRQLRCGKRGHLPDHLAPILERLGLLPDHWCQLVGQFGELFKRVVGGPPQIAAEVQRRGQRWMQCPGVELFAPG